MLAMHVCGDAFTDEEKARNFDYYERADRPRLVAVGLHAGGRSRPRSGTSSSPTTTSREAALMDLDDLEHNTRDGLHIASLAGAWLARRSPASAGCATTATQLHAAPAARR